MERAGRHVRRRSAPGRRPLAARVGCRSTTPGSLRYWWRGLAFLVRARCGSRRQSVQGRPRPAAGASRSASSVEHTEEVHSLSTINGKSSSTNWAGYAVTGSGLKSVSGSWKQPAVKCPVNQVQQASFWVGIDGFNAGDPTVQQIGTDSDCTRMAGKTTGTPNYYAWYEMYPQNVVYITKMLYPVFPGDVIATHVSRTGSTYTLSVSDPTRRWVFTTVQTATTTPLNSSGEWIVEAPCSAATPCSTLPLADFRTIAMSGLVDGSTISGSGLPVHQITMVTSGGTVKAAPSALSSSGGTFTVAWKHN